MSDILICGVEMPTGSDELRLIIRSNGQVIISHQTYFEETEAVPVPPHGDLIDKQDLFNGEQNLYAWDEIDSAPTVIPAEEE